MPILLCLHLWYPRCANARCCGSDGDRADLAESQVKVINLGDEDGSHGLIQRGPVHVDGRPDRKDKATDPGVHMVLCLQQVDGHGQRGTARASPEGRGDGICHVGDKSERQGSCYN